MTRISYGAKHVGGLRDEKKRFWKKKREMETFFLKCLYKEFLDGFWMDFSEFWLVSDRFWMVLDPFFEVLGHLDDQSWFCYCSNP